MEHWISFLTSPIGLLVASQLLLSLAHVLQLLATGGASGTRTIAGGDPTAHTQP